MKRPIKRTEKIRCTITLDKDVFVDSALFISNLSGFINKTLKDYIEYKKKELEKALETSDDLGSHKDLLCLIGNNEENIDPILEPFKKKYGVSSYEELKKIASTQWAKNEY